MHFDPKKARKIRAKTISENNVVLTLTDGEKLSVRRFFPAGVGDRLYVTQRRILIHVANDDYWLPIGASWRYDDKITLADSEISISFQEIESQSDLENYKKLREFHYRGGGGAGRTIPIIAKSQVWDLPAVLGFVEITSSMIANSARKRFFDAPYESQNRILWLKWDRAAGKRYSSPVSFS